MKISLALLSNVLFAASTLATPSGLARRMQEEKQRRNFPSPVSPPTPTPSAHFQKLIPAVITTLAEEILSASSSSGSVTENWAGVIMNPPPSGTTFNDIGATFVVPTPYPATAGPGTWSGAAWVGIYNSDAIVQAGVIWTVTVSNTGAYSYTYSAVYEWLPAGSVQYAITVNAGDTISILCAIDPSTYSTANCAIENHNTGAFVSETLVAPSSSTLDQGQTAAWIVEDFSTGTGLVPFGDFTNVTFTGCFAYAGNQQLNPTASTSQVLTMSQNNTLLTTVSFPATNNVAVTWF
jgi:hypothetical protein